MRSEARTVQAHRLRLLRMTAVFPCAGQSASSQASSLLSALKSNGVKYGTVSVCARARSWGPVGAPPAMTTSFPRFLLQKIASDLVGYRN